MTETPGQRLYKIRLACGDGVREAETLEAFSKRLEAAGYSYSAMTLSSMERMKQKWRLDDVNALSSVDPLRRGPVWLAAMDSEPSLELPDPRKDRKLTMQEIQRAKQKVDEARAEAEQKPRRKKRPGGA